MSLDFCAPALEQTPKILPPPETTAIWSAIYAVMPKPKRADLRAPGSKYRYKKLDQPLRVARGDAAEYNALKKIWQEQGLTALSPEQADVLYDYIRRRLYSQTAKLQENWQAAQAKSDWLTVGRLVESLNEYQERRVELHAANADRQAAKFAVGGEIDTDSIGRQADEWLASELITSRPVNMLGRGTGWAGSNGVIYRLPEYDLPPSERAEPVYLKVKPGQIAGLRENVARAELPLAILEDEQSIPDGAIVLNLGDSAWQPDLSRYVVLNSADALALVDDRPAMLAKLGGLAVASTRNPVTALAQFGPVFVGQTRANETDEAAFVLQNVAGDTKGRALGNLPAALLAGCELFREYLPDAGRTSWLVLGGQLIAGWDNNDAICTNISLTELELCQAATSRLNLDLAWVELVHDRASNRWLVQDVKAASSLSIPTLRQLYAALHAQLFTKNVSH